MTLILNDKECLVALPGDTRFSLTPGIESRPGARPGHKLLAPLPAQGCWCCTGRPMAPHHGASTLLWVLPAAGRGAPGAARSPRSVCPRMEPLVLDSADVPRAGLAPTAAWLCVLRTVVPTVGQGLVTRYGGNGQATGGRGWYAGSPEPPSAVPQSLGVCICAEGFGGPDCGTKLDGGQLVWETLMDSRLSAVSCGCHCMEVLPASWMVLPFPPSLGPPLSPDSQPDPTRPPPLPPGHCQPILTPPGAHHG